MGVKMKGGSDVPCQMERKTVPWVKKTVVKVLGISDKMGNNDGISQVVSDKLDNNNLHAWKFRISNFLMGKGF